jgi:hypothetical protein
VTTQLDDRLIADLAVKPGLFHRGPGGEALWRGLTEVPLRALYDSVRPGMRTIETGSGGTTVVFAARGARHTAVTPSPDEEVRIRELCEREGVDLATVDFAIGSSDEVLPGWSEPLDVVLIDGAHRMPFPFVDFHYTARHLKVGGELWLDDIPLPAVYRLYEFLAGEPEWELVAMHDDKVAQFRKLGEEVLDPNRDDWEHQHYNRPWKWVFSHIPLHRRWRLWRRRVMLRSRIRELRRNSQNGAG